MGKYRKTLFLLIILGISQAIFSGSAASVPMLIINNTGAYTEKIMPLRGGCQKIINNCSHPIGIPLYPSGATKSFLDNVPSCITLSVCTRTAACAGTLPTNSVWNTSSGFTQTFDGIKWIPTSKTASYSATGSSNDCKYTCASGYHTENGGASCTSNTKTAQCTQSGAPSNASYTIANVNVTWNGTSWSTPANCAWTCNTGYHNEGGTCVLNTKSVQCTQSGAPSNASYTIANVNVTWNGTSWSTPANCAWTCNSGYRNSGGSCINTCALPWGGTITHGQTVTAYDKSSGTCPNNNCASQIRTCNGTNGTLNGTYTYQSCSNAGNTQSCTIANGVGSQSCTAGSTSRGTCSLTSCNTNYHTEDNVSCISNTRTASCSALPGGTVYNTASSISQNWIGYWSPTLTSSYNINGSTTECRYKCAGGYLWNGSACVAGCRTNADCDSGKICNGYVTATSSSCAGTYQVDNGYCGGNCAGAKNPDCRCSGLIQSACGTSWDTHGCSRNSNITTYSCSAFNTNQTSCQSKPTCTWYPAQTERFGSCVVPASCTTPRGTTVAHGNSITAYQSSSVACGNSCVSQTRTCNNGVLGGTYLYSSCSVQSCSYCGDGASCPIGYSCHGTICLRDLGGCFVQGTKVLLANGILVPIETITTGDIVLGANGSQNTVVKLYKLPSKSWKLYAINNSDYFVTDTHPFMTTEGWKSFNPQGTLKENPDMIVSELKIGDILVTKDGIIPIYDIDFTRSSGYVYNFKLDGNHTYYADGYLVHNPVEEKKDFLDPY